MGRCNRLLVENDTFKKYGWERENRIWSSGKLRMGWACVYMIPMMMGEDIKQRGLAAFLVNAFYNISES
jgi:hypothetical protein